MSEPETPQGRPLDLALIGNCRIAALLDGGGRIVWWCFPRFDSNPVFSRLLSGTVEKGFSDVVMNDQVHARADYARNTAILETELEDRHGGRLLITDFAPRFTHFDRMFRPAQLIRRITPLAGMPRIAIRVRPTHSYGQPCAVASAGSNHIRYTGSGPVLRLTTDAPLSYILHETTFPLTRPLTIVLGPDEPFQSALGATTRGFEDQTREYWQHWVRSLAVPLEWQQAVTRAAMALKLCSFEETGAIVAAHTTSIPEAPGSGRNWDYRYCWLRDAHCVVQALNRLGITETMEAFINYITAVAADEHGPLKPVHGIVPGTPLDEYFVTDLDGFLGQGPVRVGNEAAAQTQHDVYGSVILATQQMFIDERLPRVGDVHLFHQLERLGTQAARVALRPDAGIWEYRDPHRARAHTHSAAVCWAACDRLARIGTLLGLGARAAHWRQQADSLRATILQRAWNEQRGVLMGTLDDGDLDASVLLLAEFGLIDATDTRFVRTCETIGRDLSRGGRIMRYTAEDDFGKPETAFLVCNFWYIDALASIGRRDEARQMFTDLLARRNAFGLLSEDIHPVTGALWGNLPQTYSMAAIVDSAARLSLPWGDAWRRG
jgi:GH15 family glucan-1,4-alpha-glucosidase